MVSNLRRVHNFRKQKKDLARFTVTTFANWTTSITRLLTSCAEPAISYRNYLAFARINGIVGAGANPSRDARNAASCRSFPTPPTH